MSERGGSLWIAGFEPTYANKPRDDGNGFPTYAMSGIEDEELEGPLNAQIN